MGLIYGKFRTFSDQKRRFPELARIFVC